MHSRPMRVLDARRQVQVVHTAGVVHLELDWYIYQAKPACSTLHGILYLMNGQFQTSTAQIGATFVSRTCVYDFLP